MPKCKFVHYSQRKRNKSLAEGVSKDEWVSCIRKVKLTKNEAKARARKEGLIFYKCRHCNGYHMSSKGAPISDPVHRLLYALFGFWVTD